MHTANFIAYIFGLLYELNSNLSESLCKLSNDYAAHILSHSTHQSSLVFWQVVSNLHVVVFGACSIAFAVGIAAAATFHVD